MASCGSHLTKALTEPPPLAHIYGWLMLSLVQPLQNVRVPVAYPLLSTLFTQLSATSAS